MDFLEHIKQTAEDFKKTESKIVRVIGNSDSDGIAGVSIVLKVLLNLNRKFVSSIVNQVDERLLEELEKEPYQTYFFIDLGSNSLKLIENHLKDKEVFVLDHHAPEKDKTSLHHCNPFLFDIDGRKDISAAGICYFFGKELGLENSNLAYLAVIGAIGDNHEKRGFTGFNKTILDEAILSEKMTVKSGLRMFGSVTKPLHKMLEYSTNPYIPGITGNENGAIKFLESIGIDTKGENVKLAALDDEKLKKLVTEIILKRMGSEDEPEDLFGNVYILNDEDDESPTKDALEFSTLLNCCCRMNQASLGIGTCLGSADARKKAIILMSQYRKELINGLEWFYKNKGNQKEIYEGKGHVIINAEEAIRDAMVGTLTSTISKSNVYLEGTVIMTFAHTLGDETKISCRVSGFKDKGVDLNILIKSLLKKIGCGSGGGHKLAAGAVIPQDKEEEFIEEAKRILAKKAQEETII